ncbi:nitrate/nitrite transporter NrtS [Limibacillus halophilus]|uniref:Methyl-accepting chemotaxis protein n=1 Tax=Limibacillus halophilus TaxID=1579333 RepID=A0A839SYW3_9PROT|nr:nitrate/nitrite transporter NrtS [Limibacillus halophilus]MBB3066776.1 methyl-accepting chemotaxis protein [Limibacillus halophilus]
MPNRPKSILGQVLTGAILRRSLIVTFIVGSLLNVINQGDSLFTTQPIDWIKLCLTFCVPFLVTTYGAYSALMAQKP